MRDARRRPMGWLFYWTLVLSAAIGFGLPAFGAGAPPQSGAGATTVSDTVYLADGIPASGNLIISWPAFVTAGGTMTGPITLPGDGQNEIKALLQAHDTSSRKGGARK